MVKKINITSTGNKFKIDVSHFFNVFKGNMSIVAILPYLLNQIEVVIKIYNYKVNFILLFIKILYKILDTIINLKLLSELDGLYLKVKNVISNFKLLISTLNVFRASFK